MKTYYIYHIPGVKIGCTDNVKQRVVKHQLYNQYEILETHSDIYIASDREIELQKQYGYKVDCTPYWKTLKIGNYNTRSKGGKKGIKTLFKNNSHIDGGLTTKEKYSYKVIVYSSNNIIGTYDSIRDCAKKLNCDRSAIRNVCIGKRKSHKGYTFQYKH